METTTSTMNSREVMALIRASAKPYYVYVLFKPNGVPFYVGKGAGHRATDHEREAKSTTRKTHKLAVIRKIQRDGLAVGYGIDSWHEDDASAIAREIALIAEIGRKDLKTGPLTNYTDGGDSPVIGEQTRARNSAAQKRYFANPDSRKKTSEATKRYFAENPEAREELSRRARERCDDPAYRDRLRQIRRKYLEDNPDAGKEHSKRLKDWLASRPDWLAELNAKRAAVLATREVRAKMSASHLRWREQNPEAYAANQRKGTETRRTPEFRRLASEATKRFNAANPHVLAERSRKRQETLRSRLAVRVRCEALAANHSLEVVMPDARSSLAVWVKFESTLNSLIQEMFDAHK